MAGILGGQVVAGDACGVAPGRLEKLTKGINLSHWFAQTGNYAPEQLEAYNTARDAALIKAMGFRHVRFAFNEATVLDDTHAPALDPEKMKRFDAALDLFLNAGLAVIVDFHPEEPYKEAVEKDDDAVANLVSMWRDLAGHLSSRDPETLFLEVINEPTMRDSARWNVIQKRVLAAMRESAPHHTLIATGAAWSDLTMLRLTEVVPDRNVVYNFHCYEPFKFTHQDAPWVGECTKDLTNAPYPSSPDAVARLLPDLPDDKARQLMIQYGKENWNAAKIDAFIAGAAEWGRKNGVAVTCNEFGVYRKAPPADRNRCIADVRTALEKYAIGWCMWDYAGGFSVAPGKPGERVPDTDTVRALGLIAPGVSYYVDTQSGDDSAEGSIAAPWRSIERVNKHVFAPGDSLLFKAGCRWEGQLRPKGSGVEGQPIRVDRYGEGARPVIDMGSATGAVIQFSNQEYWEVRHLELTSGAPTAAEHRQGVLVLGSGLGRVFHHIIVADCHIHDIWGLMGGRVQGIDSYTSTAILVASPRGDQVATFDNVLIEGNVIERVDRSGIIVWTPTEKASATRVVVRRNRVRDVGGDAILVLGSVGALVEYNVVNDASARCGGADVVLPDGGEGYNFCAAAIWLHTCDGVIMQYNEVYDTRVVGNNQDGQAFDFDYNCTHCVLQYNYSRNNVAGWLLIMPTAEHNIARFNISENDTCRLMCGGSSFEANNRLYNNTFYNDRGLVQVFTNASYINNIFYATGKGQFVIAKRKPGLMSHNLYFGPWVKLPEDAGALLADPKLEAPGSGGVGLDSLDGYRPRADSPCVGGGQPLGPGEKDFSGNPLLEGEKLIGARR